MQAISSRNRHILNQWVILKRSRNWTLKGCLLYQISCEKQYLRQSFPWKCIKWFELVHTSYNRFPTVYPMRGRTLLAPPPLVTALTTLFQRASSLTVNFQSHLALALKNFVHCPKRSSPLPPSNLRWIGDASWNRKQRHEINRRLRKIQNNKVDLTLDKQLWFQPLVLPKNPFYNRLPHSSVA